MGMNTALLASALEYASRGWAVFPILPDLGERPDPSTSSHRKEPKLCPVDWEQWATTDSVRIAKVWGRRPWGIGIALGPSNLLVVESELTSDGLMPGETRLHDLAARFGSLPSTWTVTAPTGSLIRCYQHPNRPVTTTGLGPHLLVRASGQYTVAPPTVTSQGTWHLLQNQAVARLPHWFTEILTQQ